MSGNYRRRLNVILREREEEREGRKWEGNREGEREREREGRKWEGDGEGERERVGRGGRERERGR